MNTALMAFPRREAARIVGVDERVLARWASSGVLRPSDEPFYSFTDLVGLRALAKMRQHKVSAANLLAVLRARGGDQAIWSSRKFLVIGGHAHVFEGQRLERPDTGQQAAARLVLAPKETLAEVTALVRQGRERQPEAVGRIVRDRGVCGGRARFDGTRIEVSLVQGLLAEKWSASKILAEYPSLRREDVKAAADFSARRARSA